MPRFIVKLADQGRDYFMEWSTVVDAPVTYGMPLDEFREWYRSEYGSEGMRGLDERLARVAQHGTSAHDGQTAEDMIIGNRAGPDESEATMGQIVQHYIRDRPDGDDDDR